ncbi:hypothetical protein GRI62_11415 [Erythrobacter arachoides]|uniref:Heme oxygenase n=1 Tax=Aurantiacibacter arachoides TaxID=1850444 RepID=A0A845A113_9SPHN|nr:hypothetical protein [Aurantiacibacter arachoides]MXO94203.1 hypothetical protein [Aurantiacibacter arachoides]GGD65292.1 hypothetical protein GCM10011411_27040 [Aurantiacibacter arachoides]
MDGIGAPASFADREAYAAFLANQLAAREGVERWAAHHCPPDLAPPEVTPLIVADLQDLGSTIIPATSAPFALPAGSDAIGLAWVVAGSHLGNRAMLARLRREAPGAPVAFLADERMQQFWKQLRPRLAAAVSPAEAERAAIAAEAVFDHFLAVFAGPAHGRAPGTLAA